jgi:hypothetical protein
MQGTCGISGAGKICECWIDCDSGRADFLHHSPVILAFALDNAMA